MRLQRHLVLAILCSGLLLSLVAGGESKPTAESPQALFDGIGSIHHPVSTASSLAQRYFDQGLAFTYGFNHDEAERAFQQSANIDRNLAMAYWGVALVLGPNYNLPGDKERGMRAVAALKQAQSHETNAT